MANINIDITMEKLFLINKQLGGTAKDEAKKNQNEFDVLKDVIMEQFYACRMKQNELSEKMEKGGRSTDTMKIEIEINEKISDIEKKLEKLNSILRQQSKDKKQMGKIEQREKVYANLKKQMKDLKNFGKTGKEEETKEQTVTDLKATLLDPAIKRDASKRPQNVKMSEEEKQAISRYKENDKQMDVMLDQINEGVLQWGDKAKQIGQKIDHTVMQIEKLDSEIQNTNKQLENSNKNLKKIVDEYRKPGHFCFDLFLIITFLVLISIIIKMKSGSSS